MGLFGYAVLVYSVIMTILISIDFIKYNQNIPYKPNKKKRKLFLRIYLGFTAGIHYVNFIGTYNHKKYNTQVYSPKTLECYLANLSAFLFLIAYIIVSWQLYSNFGSIALSFLAIPIILNSISIFAYKNNRKIIKKKIHHIIGRFFQVGLIIASLMIIFIGEAGFLITSLIFFSSGGAFEYIIMDKFRGNLKYSISKKDNLLIKIKNSFLWVHRNILFMKKYGTTIYNFDRLGSFVCVGAYLIMFFYIVLGFYLFNLYSYAGMLIYLIPIFTNLWDFMRNKYLILN